MPFTKDQSQDLTKLRDTAYGWGKIVVRRAYGDQGPGLDLDFDSIESLAGDMGQAVIRGTVEEILKTQFNRLGDHQPCPGCQRPSPVAKAPRTIQARGGTIEYDEPVCHCPACRREFFPLRPSLRLDSHDFSPAIFGKIVRAVARCGSFADAAESLSDEAEVEVSDRRLGRIADEVGGQRRDSRDRQVEEFRTTGMTPEVSVAPRLAVVTVDRGRLQTRSPEPGLGPGAHDPAWREDQVADLVTMSTESHDEDPHPDLPRCFTKTRQVVELVQGVAGQGALADVIETTAPEPPPLAVFEPTEVTPSVDWRPEPLVRTWLATRESSEALGPMVAAEAKRRNFDAAQTRAFPGDDNAWIWTLQRTSFSRFEPIVNFVHVLTHISLAAKAVGDAAAEVWERYPGWATACWRGRVATVLDELRPLLDAMPPTANEETKPTDPSEVIRLTIGHLENNQSRMDYPRSRRLGLPTCSGLVESLVKQFNRRVNGTEKFWNPSHAETILQLRAADLSEDERLAKHLKNRPISAFRRYKTRKRRKAA